MSDISRVSFRGKYQMSFSTHTNLVQSQNGAKRFLDVANDVFNQSDRFYSKGKKMSSKSDSFMLSKSGDSYLDNPAITVRRFDLKGRVARSKNKDRESLLTIFAVEDRENAFTTMYGVTYDNRTGLGKSLVRKLKKAVGVYNQKAYEFNRAAYGFLRKGVSKDSFLSVGFLELPKNHHTLAEDMSLRNLDSSKIANKSQYSQAIKDIQDLITKTYNKH